MPPEPTRPAKPLSKNPYLYTSLLIALAALYSGYIVFSRWHENRSLQRRNAEENSQRQRESDLRTLEQFGGKDLAIQNFYGGPAIIHRGESVQICYGVANAKTITIDPPIGSVWPSNARCLDASPKKNHHLHAHYRRRRRQHQVRHSYHRGPLKRIVINVALKKSSLSGHP